MCDVEEGDRLWVESSKHSKGSEPVPVTICDRNNKNNNKSIKIKKKKNNEGA
jgi:hypothetical protein